MWTVTFIYREVYFIRLFEVRVAKLFEVRDAKLILKMSLNVYRFLFGPLQNNQVKTSATVFEVEPPWELLGGEVYFIRLFEVRVAKLILKIHLMYTVFYLVLFQIIKLKHRPRFLKLNPLENYSAGKFILFAFLKQAMPNLLKLGLPNLF